MKRKKLLGLLLLVISSTFAQKVIENPQHGLDMLPGEIQKIELTESATILHFHIHAKGWISIPKESYIVPFDTEEKLFVTKAEGIPLGEKYILNDSGIKDYKLFFPPLKKGTGKIDFKIAKNKGNWAVYDIVGN